MHIPVAIQESTTTAAVSTGELPSAEEVLSLIERVHDIYRSVDEGAVADYIPALADADPLLFGICIAGVRGLSFGVGDALHEFSIQSISKAFVFALVCDVLGHEEAREKLGRVRPRSLGQAGRISGINQLPTDALYWTNLSYESFRTTGADRNPWLRQDAYLTSKLKDVLLEWGCDPATTPPDYTATFCSTMFSRVMTLAYRLARECDERVRMSTLFSGDTLRADLRRLLPPLDYPTGEAAAVLKAGQGFAEFTRTSMRSVKGSRLYMLRRPRLPYALEMLATPVPKGPFQFRSRRELREISPDRVAWVRRTGVPCIVEVTIDEMQQDAAPVYGFGNAMDTDHRVPRSWVTHPEFMMLSSFSSLDVKNAYVAKEYSQLNLVLPEPVRQFLSDPHVEASWSAGVLAETLWRAACMGPKKERGRNTPGEERAGTSWQGAWIRAADKGSGFLSAMRLADMGYSVSSYGYGWMLCSATEDQLPDLIRDGLSIGMFPRLLDVPQGLFGATSAIQWGGDRRSKIMAQLIVTQQKHLLWNLDRLPLYDKSQRDTVLKKILGAHKEGML